MKYKILWRRRAEGQLIAIWIRSANKTAITGYVQQIERILERDPLDQGEERVEGVRIFSTARCVSCIKSVMRPSGSR